MAILTAYFLQLFIFDNLTNLNFFFRPTIRLGENVHSANWKPASECAWQISEPVKKPLTRISTHQRQSLMGNYGWLCFVSLCVSVCLSVRSFCPVHRRMAVGWIVCNLCDSISHTHTQNPIYLYVCRLTLRMRHVAQSEGNWALNFTITRPAADNMQM